VKVGMLVKQVYYPYWDWECFKNGMWKNNDAYRIKEAIKFTSNHNIYGKAMNEVIEKWPISMSNFLTNKSINHRAYIGHCAVCYKTGISEKTTREAWRHLTKKEQSLANLQAEKSYKLWKQKYVLTLKNGNQNAINQEYQMKFHFK